MRHDDEHDGPPREGRPRLSGGDVWRLIRAAYAVSFPYFLVVLLALVLTAWILTRLIF